MVDSLAVEVNRETPPPPNHYTPFTNNSIPSLPLVNPDASISYDLDSKVNNFLGCPLIKDTLSAIVSKRENKNNGFRDLVFFIDELKEWYPNEKLDYFLDILAEKKIISKDKFKNLREYSLALDFYRNKEELQELTEDDVNNKFKLFYELSLIRAYFKEESKDDKNAFVPDLHFLVKSLYMGGKIKNEKGFNLEAGAFKYALKNKEWILEELETAYNATLEYYEYNQLKNNGYELNPKDKQLMPLSDEFHLENPPSEAFMNILMNKIDTSKFLNSVNKNKILSKKYIKRIIEFAIVFSNVSEEDFYWSNSILSNPNQKL